MQGYPAPQAPQGFALPGQGQGQTPSPTNIQDPWQHVFNQFNPVDNLANRTAIAHQQGYTPAPGMPGYVQSIQNGGGFGHNFPMTQPLGNQFSPNNQQSMGAIPISALMQAMMSDQTRLQGAANNQFGRMQGVQQGIQGAGDAGAAGILGAEAGNNPLYAQLMGMVQGQNQNQLPTWLNYTNPTLQHAQQVPGQVQQGIQQNVLPAIGAANQGADAAVANMQNVIHNYKDMTAEEARNATEGLRRNAQSTMNAIKSGINPDGTEMTEAQRAQLWGQANYDTQKQVADTNTQIFSHFNDNVANLGQTLSQFQQTAAGIHLQGGQLGEQAGQLQLGAEQLGTQAGVQLGSQMVDILSGQRQIAQLAVGLGQFIAQSRVAAQANAANLMLQGREAAGQFAQANPESVVTLFDGLMSLYNVQNAAYANRAVGGTAVT